ncbi:unnamed protein product, partial [Sphagnum troendelagicum]
AATRGSRNLPDIASWNAPWPKRSGVLSSASGANGRHPTASPLPGPSFFLGSPCSKKRTTPRTFIVTTRISNHEHPYTIDFPLDVEISYKDCLGDGSFGTVYKCTFLGVMAAAKVWKTNCINKEAAEKEASLFSKLQHPNVVQFIGYGVKESQPVIVSELMSTDLRTYLDKKKKNAGEGPPLPLLVAMNILLQIAEAMNYLHENGVMHRDLKANNVLINVLEGPDGELSSSSVQVKLTDFGESKLKLCDSGYTTPMVGTTRWRAPEVFEVEENREKYTKSADVYNKTRRGKKFSHLGINLAVLQKVQSIFVYRPSPRRFSLNELDTATGSFSPSNLVGRGGFSGLYRGKLEDGRLVAIKCQSNSESQENFWGLEIHSCLSHANIVSLIGYCVENTQFILVYDFLHQQTLQHHLHGEENVLGWEVRYKVAVGICKALEYLHDGSPRSVIHRNVNPSNILLSHDFRPQLSGFGLATWAPKRPICQADKVVGTLGYLDPEYAIAGRFSDKCDVYSFGVILLELITGCNPIDNLGSTDERILVTWARPLLDERNLDELVDPQLGSTYNVCQMQAMISAAALCVQESSQQRPKIKYLACVNVLVQMKTNTTYRPAVDSLDSSVQQACRRDIKDLILSTKQYGRGNKLTSKVAKLAKHLSKKLEPEISNDEHPYTIDFPLDVEISYKDCLGDGSFGTVYKCTFLGVMAAAKVWKTNCMNKEAAEKEARLSSKLRHPNVAQFIGYGVKENQPVIISELMSTELRRYLDEKKKNAGEEVLEWQDRYKIAVGICKALLSGFELATWDSKRPMYLEDTVVGTTG